MKRAYILATLLLASTSSYGADAHRLAVARRPTVPGPVADAFRQAGLDQTYALASEMKPAFLQGDFDGDGRPDYAVPVTRKQNGWKGIAIIHGRDGKARVIGASSATDADATDLSWLKSWERFPRGPVMRGPDDAPPPRLKGDALFISDDASVSHLLYWTGTGYAFYQLAD